MKKFVLFLFCSLSFLARSQDHQIDLSGTWRFAMDKSDVGISEQWFSKILAETVQLPGSMSTNGKGFDVSLKTQWTGQIVDSSFFTKPQFEKYRQPGNFKIPFWLQPLKNYVGAAWYQKEVYIPKEWKHHTIRLYLERCHWESRIWVDGRASGMCNSLGTPHLYDLTKTLGAGRHVITLRIDNRIKEIDPGVNSHSISDHTQTNWNGIVGKICLESRPMVSIRNIQVYPDIHNQRVWCSLVVSNSNKIRQKATLHVKVDGPGFAEAPLLLNVKPGLDTVHIDYPMGKDMKLWSEFHPFLYTFKAEIRTAHTTDSMQTIFGMREIKRDGKVLKINNKPLFLRGTLECAIFPKTGFPPTEKAEWLRIFMICRSHGLNHVRFHSWCPPEAAFDAADELGFYLQVECSSWANQSTTLGDGKPFDRYLYEESERMIETYGNHPSFCMMLYGNEPGGGNQVPFLTTFVNYWKSRDKRRLYSSGAGWPNLKVNDFLSSSKPRIQGWGEGLSSVINGAAPSSDYDWTSRIASFNQPVVSHEIGQWCVYPNFKEIPKYDGVLRARNFEIFQETLSDHGMGQLADSFLLASGKLQALCYKADIEAALRTKDFSGFQLLDLHDFPGQGTALVGVLDAFWGEKGYISPSEYSRFCNSTVPLARLPKHIYLNTDTLNVPVEVAHYGDEPLVSCTPQWTISDATGMLFSGSLPETDVPLGNGFKLGSIKVPLATIQTATKLVLEVKVENFTNSWDVWVYPAKKPIVPGVEKIRMVSGLDASCLAFLEAGGSVLLTLPQGKLKAEFGGKVAVGFSSIFWNTAWTSGQPPHTLGILCDPKHPALADFPTEYHSNWQWWDAMSHSNVLLLSSISAEIHPIVRVIDDWFTNRPLALLFEVKVGKGKLLVSGIDFNRDLEKRPEAQQLLFSLKKYMAGNQFKPTALVPAELLQSMIL